MGLVSAVLAYAVLFGVVDGLFAQPVSLAKELSSVVESALQVAMAERQKPNLQQHAADGAPRRS